MDTKHNVKFVNKPIIPRMSKSVNLGDFEVTYYDNDLHTGSVTLINPDNEVNCYKLFIRLLNVQLQWEIDKAEADGTELIYIKGAPKEPLAKGDIDYLALFMSYPLDYDIMYAGKKNIFSDFGTALNRTSISAKNSFVRIRDAGYLYQSEDKFWTLCQELDTLRKLCKKQLKEQGYFLFSYNYIMAIQ
jgi:hypothetical protein